MQSSNRFRFTDHPWISFWVLLVLVVITMLISAIVVFGVLGLPQDDPYSQFAQSLGGQFLMVFLLVPFVLRLPKGKRPFRQYLNDIGLTRIRPFSRLLLITISCYLILALCQSLGSIVYRIAEGNEITAAFIRSVFDIRSELPPRSPSLLTSLPSMFEEVLFRGVLLTLFLLSYSKPRAIVYSSLGFSVVHALNLLGGRDPVWVAGQVIWAFTLGLFYGYLFVQTGSLVPNMLFHYLGNVFVGSFGSYVQSRASIEIQALYGVVFTFGLLPTVLMISWTHFLTSRWPFPGRMSTTGATADSGP
jgi:membrane protease YdiL (CAAX protease family)